MEIPVAANQVKKSKPDTIVAGMDPAVIKTPVQKNH
jgi:hypothetical protein